jgi:very-short-patch-repair endonuclease
LGDVNSAYGVFKEVQNLYFVPNKIIPYSQTSKQFARKLRNDSTLSEVLLWKQIKGKSLGVEFHRQVTINKFVVDFYCHELSLAIEIDGISHDNLEKDNERQMHLEQLGVRFIRFADKTVKHDMNNVIWALADMIGQLQKMSTPV